MSYMWGKGNLEQEHYSVEQANKGQRFPVEGHTLDYGLFSTWLFILMKMEPNIHIQKDFQKDRYQQAPGTRDRRRDSGSQFYIECDHRNTSPYPAWEAHPGLLCNRVGWPNVTHTCLLPHHSSYIQHITELKRHRSKREDDNWPSREKLNMRSIGDEGVCAKDLLRSLCVLGNLQGHSGAASNVTLLVCF